MKQLEMLETTDERRCSICKEVKSETSFNLHKIQGRQSQCKECHRQYQREHYVNNKKRYEARDKNRQKNSIKAKAVTIVRDALRKKLLVRQPCEECGAEKAEAHHDDYAKPLEVRWLCRSHHRQHHAKHGEAPNACTVRHWTPPQEATQ